MKCSDRMSILVFMRRIVRAAFSFRFCEWNNVAKFCVLMIDLSLYIGFSRFLGLV